MQENNSDGTFQQPYLKTRILHQYLLTALMLNLITLVIGINNASGVGSVFGFSGSLLLALAPVMIMTGGLIVILVLLRSKQREKLLTLVITINNKIPSWNMVGLALFFILLLFWVFYFLLGFGLPVLTHPLRFWLFGYSGIIGAMCISRSGRITASTGLLASYSAFALVFCLIHFLPEIVSFPLSLDWSEASRFYDASLFFSRRIYGRRLPLPALDPTRAFLQSIPFIIPSLPIWIHRLWRVVLWLGFPLMVGFSLASHIRLTNRWLVHCLSIWFLLFSFQGPFYFHLMVVVIITIAGFDKERLPRSLFFVILASLWAGMSRVNWFPMAGIIAATLYILDTPQEGKTFWQYWRWPITAVFIGLVSAFGSQALYAVISGNPPESYMTSVNSPLLWYRLWPNEAYGWGVFFRTIIAGLPLWFIIVWQFIKYAQQWRFLRRLALITILITLLAAGLLVSTKIGGGNNIHNLDAYLVVMAIIAIYLVFDRFAADHVLTNRVTPIPVLPFVLAFLIPMVTMFNSMKPYVVFDNAKALKDIEKIQALIDQNVSDHDQVLFIHQRQLLIFGYIQGVDMVPEYEKVFLMEAAMSENQTYLHNFWDDLQSHRFSLIITEPVVMVNRSSADIFGEENNAWVKNVTKPLTEHYQVVLALEDSGISVLAPND